MKASSYEEWLTIVPFVNSTSSLYESAGIATRMAELLIPMAHDAGSGVLVTAQMLSDRNASYRVLEKLGFARMRTLEHPDDGTVIEWQETEPVVRARWPALPH